MSRNKDDFVFCGRRVRVTTEALLVSQEFAASSVVPVELCGPQRSAETMLTCSEHREYRSLLRKLQWLQLQSRPDLSYEVNRAAQRFQRTHGCRCSSAQCNFSQGPVILGNHPEIHKRSDRCVHGSAGDAWRCLLCQHGRFEESVRCHRIGVNSSLGTWYAGQATQSNVWFRVLSQLRHSQYQKLLRKHSGSGSDKRLRIVTAMLRQVFCGAQGATHAFAQQPRCSQML